MAQDAESTAPSGPVKVPGAAPEKGAASSPATTVPDPLSDFLPENDLQSSDQRVDVGHSSATRTVVEKAYHEAVAVVALETPAKSVKLVSDDLILRQYGKLLSQLQQRVSETTASFQAQLGEFVIEQQRIEDAVVQLAQLNSRAVSLTRDLDRRALELDSRKQSIDRALVEARETLSNVQERSIELFDHHRRFEASELALARLDQQAREATAGLRQRIDTALGDLECQTAETTTRLDKRLEAAELQRTAIDQLSAELQRRAAVTTEQLEHALDELDSRKPGLELQAKELDDSKEAINRALSVVEEILPDLQAQTSELSQYHQQFETSKWALAHVEQQALDATRNLEQRIDDALADLERRTVNASTGLDKRIEGAEAQQVALEQVSGVLEQRAAATTQALGHTFDEADSKKASLELQATELDDRKDAIKRILLEAATILPDLQAQSSELSEHHQRFEASRDALARLDQQARETAAGLEQRVESVLGDLERRTVNASTALDKRVEDAEAQKAALEQMSGALEQRAAATTQALGHTFDEADSKKASLELHAKELDDRKAAIIRILLEAATILPDLQAHSSELSHHHQHMAASTQALARVEQQAREAADSLKQRVDDALADLERRSVDASADLGKRLEGAVAQKAVLEQSAADVEQRTAHGIRRFEHSRDELDSRKASLEVRAKELDDAKQAIDRVLFEVASIFPDLKAQSLELSEHHQRFEASRGALARLDDAASGLEQRVEGVLGNLARRTADASSSLEKRLDDVEVQKAAVEKLASDLERRTDAASHRLDQRLHDLDNKSGNLERALGHAAQTLLTLQAQIARASEREQSLHDYDRRIAGLEQRAADATGRLDERMKAFDAQRETIDRTLADVMRTAGLVSDLENRSTRLIGSGGQIDRGKDRVEHLEQLASAASAQLKQLTRTKSDLEREFANLHARVKKAVKAAQNGARQLSELNRQTDVTSTAQPTWSLRASVTAMWRRYQNLEDPLLSPIIVIGGVSAAILIALVAATAISSRPSEARPAAQPLSALPSRPQPTISPALLIAEPQKVLNALPPAPAAAREPLPVQALSEASARSQAFVGSLAINSIPQGATIFVNRRMVGETPFVVSDLSVGSYVIRLERQGFQPWTASATVSAIHQTQVTATLQADNPRGPQ